MRTVRLRIVLRDVGPAVTRTIYVPATRALPDLDDVLQVLADPRHPEAGSIRTWVGDRVRPFDREGTARRVRDAAGAVHRPLAAQVCRPGDGRHQFGYSGAAETE